MADLWLEPAGADVPGDVARRSLPKGLPRGERRRRLGEWLTPKEVAADLGLSVWQVTSLIAQGELPAYRIGRSVRIHGPDVRSRLDDDPWDPRPHFFQSHWAPGASDDGHDRVRRVVVDGQRESGISARAAAEMLGVSAGTIARWVEERRLGPTLTVQAVERFIVAARIDPETFKPYN